MTPRLSNPRGIKMNKASYWFIGTDTDSLAVAVDILNSKNELIRETWAADVIPFSFERGKEIAENYAKSQNADVLHFDSDSTEFFADC